ncbi:nuA3 HAT complex component nto1 [Mortierella sp. GBA43]|nr:nuA3 HAT complex component nto1 [Mortierella sp. GBA43]
MDTQTLPATEYAISHSSAISHSGASRRSSSGARKRIRHRKGRPGPALRAKLKEQERLAALGRTLEDHENAFQHSEHTNHSLLANHPSSARHDYNADDENKPREERSYQEFYPYLKTSIKLDIVDLSEAQSKAEESENPPTTSDTNQPVKSGEDTGADSMAEGMDMDITPITSGSTMVRDANSQHSNALENEEPQDSLEAANGSSKETSMNGFLPDSKGADSNPDENQTSTPNQDGSLEGDGSDPDVFFDAKGFVEGEPASDQKPIVQHEDGEDETEDCDDSGEQGTGVEHDNAAVESEAMDVDADAPTEPSAGIEDIPMKTIDPKDDEPSLSAVPLQDVEMKPATNRVADHVKIVEKPSSIVIKDLPARPSSTTVLEPKTPMSLLPKSSFRQISREDDVLKEYHLPAGHNVRYIEPTETELAERVEYDMDEQDEYWLKEINTERRKQDLGEITPSLFEEIIDRLEKEWFDLTKNIPKSVENLPPEDSACNICDDGECENSNAIVFCDGCNLAVHQDCYGIPYIPEGQWLCRKCMLSPQMPVSCIFCPAEGGAFKQTTNSRWAHLLCASWIPEVGVANTVYMEPIDNIDKIPASRWKLTCYICKLRMGACIQCETKNCFRAFHVTCARRAHLYMKSRLSKVSSSGGEVLIYRAHCHKHTPRDYKAAIDIAGAAAVIAHKGIKKKRAKVRVIDDETDDPDYGRSDQDEKSSRRRTTGQSGDKDSMAATLLGTSSTLGSNRTSKAALAHQKHYTPGAPLAPMFIVNRLLPFVSKRGAKTSALRKVSALNFVYTICKYWSLKRESRRGAPLLKRLHLEPWTASASAHRQTEEEKLKKLQTQLLLRGDLEKVRMLAELVRKREKAKLKRQELQNRYLCRIMFPLKTILEDALTEVEKLDKQKYFAYPISPDEVKDYHEVIKDPICFQTIGEKLTGHEYRTIDEFCDDIRRIYHNCLTYNKVDTKYYRAARKQFKQAEPFLQKAKEEYDCLDIDPRTGFLNVPIDPEIFTYNLVPFQRPDEDDHKLAADGTTGRSSKSRRKDTPELLRSQVIAGRSLRAISGRVFQTAMSANDANQRGLSKHPSRPEVPKLKTATVTRADVAKAREAGDTSVVGATFNEDELLEKLKSKSKKSRSLAVSLQSRLKPSIVSKVVEVINKPAPKGWAYVVVEGEEDSSEEEEEGEDNQEPSDEESQERARAREAARERRRDERRALTLKRKLEKEKKAKARAESRLRALKAPTPQPGNEGNHPIQDTNAETSANQGSSAKQPPTDSVSSRSRLRRSQTQSIQQTKDSESAIADPNEQEPNSALAEADTETQEKDQDADFSANPKSRGHTTIDTSTSKDASVNETPSPTERTTRSQTRQADIERDTASHEPKGADIDTGINQDEDKDMDEWAEDDGEVDSDVAMEDEEDVPQLRRHGRSSSLRSAAQDSSADGAGSVSTRRLRSTEASPPIPSSVGLRRGSSAGQRNVDIAAKRRRSESSEGSSKKLKSDRSGGPLAYGSLVWAKMEGFPWFPAELMDPKGSYVPAQVLEMKRDGQGHYLVQFFDLRERGDRGRSWYWMTTPQVSPLGVDLDEDRKRVHLKAGWNPKRRKSVKQAYIDACELKGIDPAVVLAETGY